MDFDLSHHLDSFDVSVSTPGQANGYLAPEQVESHSGVSTRNATVDSFGLGMTFYFLRTGIEPRFAQHRYTDWRDSLRGCAHNYPCKEWVSLPLRFARLIYNSTMEFQENRMEVANIENELIWLEEAISNSSSVISAELLAEELAARALDNQYEWDRNSLMATHDIANVQLRVMGDEKQQRIRFEFAWLQQSQFHHQDVKRWLPKAQEKIISVFKKAGWNYDAVISTGQISGSSWIETSSVKGQVLKQSEALRLAKEALTFA